jgi:hypothetical protein
MKLHSFATSAMLAPDKFDSATARCFCVIVHDPRVAFFADPNALLLPSIALCKTRHMPRARLTRSKI